MRYGEIRINLLRRIRANILLRSFRGQPSDIFRAVHLFSDNAFFLSSYSREFFCRLHNLLQQGKIKGIKRIFIFQSQAELCWEQSLRIVGFHASTSGYSYRVISRTNYVAIAGEYNIHPATDFGVFGGKRVYRARADRPDFVIGTWSRDAREVATYKAFFEACWQSPCAFQLDQSCARNTITLDQLFGVLETR